MRASFTIAATAALAGCHPRTDYIDLGLRDPQRVRVELHDRKQPSGKVLSLEEGQSGAGRTVPLEAGHALDPYDARGRVDRMLDGSLVLRYERLPDDPESGGGYQRHLVIWRRTPDGLRLANTGASDSIGTFVAQDAATWRFDRARDERLSIEAEATLAGQSGLLVAERYARPPAFFLSTRMENVRWARAATVERSSRGFFLLAGALSAAGLSAAAFALDSRVEGRPSVFFVGLGVGFAVIGTAMAGLATYTFVRGDRETSVDLVAPRP